MLYILKNRIVIVYVNIIMVWEIKLNMEYVMLMFVRDV